MGDGEGGMTERVMVKPHFVLVHGISGGAWCWYKIRCLMENSGYRVSCIDLKGSGIDQTDPTTLVSFDDYNKPLMDFMSNLPDNEQVILVGHSAGGLSVTQATHKFSNKIRLAVYVAATMLKLGCLTDEDLKDKVCCCRESSCQFNDSDLHHADPEILVTVNEKSGVPDLSEFGDVYELQFGSGPDQAPTTALVKKEFQRKIIYHMSPREDSTLASMLLRPGPIKALLAARFVDDHNVDKVRRIYIKTTHDRVVKPEQQDAMIKRWPPSEIYVLDSDHSPFFSAPFLLFGFLLKAVTSCGIKL